MSEEIDELSRKYELTELEKLRQKAAEFREQQTKKKREHYQYAKSKGFSPSEAAILMSKPKEYIDRLAEEATNG